MTIQLTNSYIYSQEAVLVRAQPRTGREYKGKAGNRYPPMPKPLSLTGFDVLAYTSVECTYLLNVYKH